MIFSHGIVYFIINVDYQFKNQFSWPPEISGIISHNPDCAMYIVFFLVILIPCEVTQLYFLELDQSSNLQCHRLKFISQFINLQTSSFRQSSVYVIHEAQVVVYSLGHVNCIILLCVVFCFSNNCLLVVIQAETSALQVGTTAKSVGSTMAQLLTAAAQVSDQLSSFTDTVQVIFVVK